VQSTRRTSDLREYYEGAVVTRDNDDESLFEIPTDMLDYLTPKLEEGARCLDIGYGAGYHSKWLHDAGCHVTAVDIIDPKLAFDVDHINSSRMDIHQMSALDFRIGSPFDILICRNVMHFFPSIEVGRLLREWAINGSASSKMYITCFTNIERIDRYGRRQIFDSEANFRTEEYLNLANDLLGDWDVEINEQKHVQTNSRGQNFFKSNNIILKCWRSKNG
jgi:hypothetical protein